ncbi:PTS sugar transporter subunit IIA [Luteimonas vadosa]
MPFDDLLAADRIVMLMDPIDRNTVLDAAARLLAGDPGGLTQAIAEGLRARERAASTAIGRGVALPHCRDNAFAGARGAFLRLAYPVDFGAGDGEPVDLVFAMCAPEDETGEHLHTLAKLAERFSDAQLREDLREATEMRAIRDALLSTSRGDIWNIATA